MACRRDGWPICQPMIRSSSRCGPPISRPWPSGCAPHSAGLSHGTISSMFEHVEAIREAGYSVVPDVLTAAEIADLSAALDALVSRQAEEFGGAQRIDAIGDTLTVRCPVAYDDRFLRLVTH